MNELINIINKCKNNDNLMILFALIFTNSELEDFEKRIKIIRNLLISEKTQREIAKELNVSIFNISRGVNLIKNNKNNIKIVKNLFLNN
jgi:Trp operon repressor